MQMHTILVAVDTAAEAAHVMPIATGMAKALGARLHIVCAIDEGFLLPVTSTGVVTAADEADYPAAAIERTAVEALVVRCRAEAKNLGLMASVRIEAGEPVQTILMAATQCDAGMVILGHRHRSWFGRLAEGSVARAVIDRSPHPVLVVPAPGQVSERMINVG